MSHTRIGLISPRDRQTAVLQRDNGPHFTHTSPVVLDGRTVTLGDYLSRFSSTEFLAFSNPNEIEVGLSKASDRSCCLDFCIMLLDPDYSLRLKQRAAEELDVLLQDESNEHYALDILLSHPLPKNTDFETPKTATSSYNHAFRTICLLEETRDRVELAYNAWLAIRTNPMVVKNGEQRTRAKLIASGTIRKAVVDLTTQSSDHRAGGALLINAKEHLDPRIVSAFLNEYKSGLPRQATRSVVENTFVRQTTTEVDFPDTDKAMPIRPRGIRRNAEAERERAVTEVTKIAELYLEGKDHNAKGFLNDLIQRQSTESDHSYLVKSLCNIASKCSRGGRYDAASECLTTALQYNEGVDSRLFVQLAQLFRDLGKLDHATDCLERAKPLAENADHDIINREFARILGDKGEYTRALAAFRSLSDIDTAPESRTAMATLLRKMGNLQTARQIYDDVWDMHETHQAYAGLAEVNRQTGRLDKAIRKYTQLLDEMKIDDDRSVKVYNISLSSLFRTLGSYTAAKKILEQLSGNYRFDVSIRLELAKVYRLLGEFDRADSLYSDSKSQLLRTDRLAAQLYDTAVMTKKENREPQVLAIDVLPEFETLSRCNTLLRGIIRGDEEAIRSVPPVNASQSKIHSDFNAVLSYHTKLLLGDDVNPVGDIAVNRVRKRGLNVLRMAVRALDKRDFNEALRFEQQMCLRVA